MGDHIIILLFHFFQLSLSNMIIFLAMWSVDTDLTTLLFFKSYFTICWKYPVTSLLVSVEKEKRSMNNTITSLEGSANTVAIVFSCSLKWNCQVTAWISCWEGMTSSMLYPSSLMQGLATKGAASPLSCHWSLEGVRNFSFCFFLLFLCQVCILLEDTGITFFCYTSTFINIKC